MESNIPTIIEKEFQAKVLEIKRITEGFSHYVYLVKLDKEPFEVIIRFSNNKQEKYGLSKEKGVIEAYRKKGIPAPKIYAFNESEPSYLIVERFKGLRLDTIWDSLSKQDKILLTKEIGKLAKAMHSIELEKFGNILNNLEIEEDSPFQFRKEGNLIEFNRSAREILVGFSKDFARLLSYSYVKKELAIKSMTHILNNLDKIRYLGKPKLVHGDFHTGHLFVEKINNEWKITGLIDFEFASSLAPEYDFIKLHRQGFFDDSELKEALEEGYGQEINRKAVEIYRLLRDFGFVQVMLDAGNKETADKVLSSIEERLNNS